MLKKKTAVLCKIHGYEFYLELQYHDGYCDEHGVWREDEIIFPDNLQLLGRHCPVSIRDHYDEEKDVFIGCIEYSPTSSYWTPSRFDWRCGSQDHPYFTLHTSREHFTPFEEDEGRRCRWKPGLRVKVACYGKSGYHAHRCWHGKKFTYFKNVICDEADEWIEEEIK